MTLTETNLSKKKINKQDVVKLCNNSYLLFTIINRLPSLQGVLHATVEILDSIIIIHFFPVVFGL